MRIVFVSGFLNNHLLPLCEELSKNNDFVFIATQNWTNSGFNRESIEKEYVINYFESKEKENIQEYIVNSDIAIFGGSSDDLLDVRKKTGRLAFVYTERLFKKGTWRRFIPSVRKVFANRFLKNSDNLYILCASSFVSEDLKLLGVNINRCLKFGYFPYTYSDESICELIKIKDIEKLELLYVGRLIKLKHVDNVLYCCRLLSKNNIDYTLTIVGNGPEYDGLIRLSETLGIRDNVVFTGEVSSCEAQLIMRKSSILYLPSDKNEGWGAIVNEALRYGCVCVVSDACGSAKYLIKNGENGAVYKFGDIRDMYEKTINLISQSDLSPLYYKSVKTITDEWNATIAAERLIDISKDISNGLYNQNKYTDGPLSIG